MASELPGEGVAYGCLFPALLLNVWLVPGFATIVAAPPYWRASSAVLANLAAKA